MQNPLTKILVVPVYFLVTFCTTIGQNPKIIATKPVQKVISRILTADQLFLTQGTFLLRNNNDYRYLSVNVKDPLPRAGSLVNIWGFLNNPSYQEWQFVLQDNGFYRIKSGSGFFLTQKRALVPTLDPEINEDSQLWEITELNDGFYTLKSKTNKFLVNVDQRRRDGALVGFANTVNGADKQKWHLIKVAGDRRKMTTFIPQTMGFHFPNGFAGVDASYRYGGLCGGMVYSSLDYYNRSRAIPAQNYIPANRTPLQSYIFGRQNDAAMVNQLDKWTELRMNPFGWRDAEFYEWGLQGYNGGRLEELKQLIDAGRPAPLGLYEGGTTNFEGRKSGDHQVLAVGYDVGRYKGDKGKYKQEMKIYIYDPNFPNEMLTLVPDISRTCYFSVEHGQTWRTYFVDKKYSPKTPPEPTAFNANEPEGSIRHIYVTFRTGGDDLRGGNDNVYLTVNYRDGSKQTFNNLNGSARWVDNYDETVPLVLNRPVRKSDITSFTIETTFGGGIGGDNWNLDYFIVTNGGNINIVCANCEGDALKPLFRFTGDQKTYTVMMR